MRLELSRAASVSPRCVPTPALRGTAAGKFPAAFRAGQGASVFRGRERAGWICRSTEFGPSPPDEELLEQLAGGTWRLQERLLPPFWGLCVALERLVFDVVEDLEPDDFDPRYRIWDSLDRQGESALSWMFEPDPARGSDLFPRMLIENRVYRSSVFRKIHFEMAWKQDGLQVLHITMFPYAHYDIPIFGLDMVGFGGNITLAIADLHPASMSRMLPPIYSQAMAMVKEKYGLQGGNQSRELPPWQAEISSDHVVITRPGTGAELEQFLQFANALTLTYLKVAQNVTPLDPSQTARLTDVRKAHARFCTNMLMNKKTLAQLARSFGEEEAERYMKDFMFDFDMGHSAS